MQEVVEGPCGKSRDADASQLYVARHAGGSLLKLQKALRISRELRSAAALMVYSPVKHVRMDALHVLSPDVC